MTRAVKASLVLVALILPTAILAAENIPGPVDAGGNLVAGGFSFSSAGKSFYENETGDRTQEWIVQPGGGYFVADGLALGFHLEGRWFSQGEARNFAYAMGPVLEYYWDTTGGGQAQGHVLPYAGIGYLWGRTRDDTSGDTINFNSGMLTLAAGMAWMVSSQVAADISVNYQTGHFTQKSPLDGFDLGADRWTVLIGFKAFLP